MTLPHPDIAAAPSGKHPFPCAIAALSAAGAWHNATLVFSGPSRRPLRPQTPFKASWNENLKIRGTLGYLGYLRASIWVSQNKAKNIKNQKEARSRMQPPLPLSATLFQLERAASGCVSSAPVIGPNCLMPTGSQHLNDQLISWMFLTHNDS